MRLLGTLKAEQGDLAAARELLSQPALLAPQSPMIQNNLGNVYLKSNRPDEAAMNRRGSLAALQGETPATAPRGHVTGIFDEIAQNFDSHLARLDYRIPEMLKDLMVSVAGPQARFANCVDLGCGTGMSGAAFRPYVGGISGVDVSGKMIAAARSKGIYDALYEEELTVHLLQRDERYDLVLPADVFIYVGELDALFAAVRQRMLAGGCFLFSIERCDDVEFTLRPSGRYAHSRAYIERLAAQSGFAIAASSQVKIRMEADVALMGDIFMLRRDGE